MLLIKSSSLTKFKYLIGCLSFIISLSLSAREGEGYIGIGAGETDYDNALLSKPSSKQIYIGNKYTENWGLELGIIDFSKAETEQNTTDPVSKLDGQTIFLGVKYTYSLVAGLEVYGKLGLHRWSLDFAEYNLTPLGNDDGSDPFYGVGIGYQFNKKYTLNATHSSYNLDFGNDVDSDVTVTALNFEWRVD